MEAGGGVGFGGDINNGGRHGGGGYGGSGGMEVERVAETWRGGRVKLLEVGWRVGGLEKKKEKVGLFENLVIFS